MCVCGGVPYVEEGQGQEALARRTVGAPSRTAPGREVACRTGEQRRDPCLQGTGADRWGGGDVGSGHLLGNIPDV